MNFLKRKEEHKNWYQIILWWEVRRIYYNIIIGLFGLLSFCICYVNIPLVYLALALGLNVCYTFLYVFELLFVKRVASEKLEVNYPKYSFIFIAYLILSIIFIIGLSLFMLVSIQSGI
jgi:hypothetical protein